MNGDIIMAAATVVPANEQTCGPLLQHMTFGNHIGFFRMTHTAVSVLCCSLGSEVTLRDL